MYSRTAVEEDLHHDVGHVNPFITSDMEIHTARICSIKNSLTKKFVGWDPKGSCNDKALEKFLRCNDLCKSYRVTPRHILDDLLIGSLRDTLSKIILNGPAQNLDMWSFSDYLDLGPGANVGALSYNFYSKLYDSKLTFTNDHLVRLYRTIISRNPTKYRAEKHRYFLHGFRMTEGSRLSFVPKTTEISRVICTEPTLNMLFQKGLGWFIERYIDHRYNIRFSVQPDINRRLARIGSIDGSFATIDLESASDSISNEFCERFLPQDLLKWIKLTRSPTTRLPSRELVNLEMVSSMGNAFTFPLQTYIFSAIVETCYALKGISFENGRSGHRNFSVFGDDIIVRKDCYDYVVHCLELCGFRVNKEKSFNSGHFRESCGEDYYRGHNVRGVYLRSLDTPSDVYSAVNRLSKWSAIAGVPLIRTLRNLVGIVKLLPIPIQESDDAGIMVPLSIAKPHLKWNKRYQAYVYKCLKPKPFEVKLPQPKDPDTMVDFDLFYSGKMIFRNGRQRGANTRFGYNPDGLLHSFVGGFIRDGKLLLRSKATKYQYRRNTCSNWDFVPTESGSFSPHFGAWEGVMTDIL